MTPMEKTRRQERQRASSLGLLAYSALMAPDI